MGFRLAIARAATCVALSVAGTAVIAAPPEPLLATRLPDPDPNFVPLRAESKRGSSPDEQAPLDDAMQEFGRAIGQAALLEQRQIAARCQAGEPASATAEQRFAWAAACSYSRH
jgi:hypothetical protein